MIVNISEQLLNSLEVEAVKAHPHEACALLVGEETSFGFNVTAIHFSNNVTEADKSRFFEIDPQIYINLERELRHAQENVIGVWHSHPSSPGKISEQDKQSSVMKNWLWLITGLKPTTEILAFKTDKSSEKLFEKVSINITP